MNISSIIVVGITLGTLLIVSCISLNASKYYNEVEINEMEVVPSVELDIKSKIVLRDRTS